MCPKPFSWAKNKRKRFSDGKSRGPLLARVALKHKIEVREATLEDNTVNKRSTKVE